MSVRRGSREDACRPPGRSFGVLTEIDIKEKLKEKLGVTFAVTSSWATLSIRRSRTDLAGGAGDRFAFAVQRDRYEATTRISLYLSRRCEAMLSVVGTTRPLIRLLVKSRAPSACNQRL